MKWQGLLTLDQSLDQGRVLTRDRRLLEAVSKGLIGNAVPYRRVDGQGEVASYTEEESA